MAMLDLLTRETSEDVAKRAPINERAVSAYCASLQAAGRDRSAFDQVMSKLKNDQALKAGDVIEIAARYTRGRKSSSKAAAYTAMAKHIVELIRSDAKALLAAKSRPL
jgi:hypothetical protein